LVAGGAVAMGGLGLTWRPGRPRPHGPYLPADDLLADLRPGTRFARWTVVAVHPRAGGLLPIELKGADGVPFQVDLARRDPEGPRPVAETATLALYLSNGGRGDTATVEEHGLGVMALAARLQRREASGAQAPQLLTLRERSRERPDGVFRVRG
jgi:hypothetical protein